MAVRNTAARRIPGDPLAGVLRQTARMARRPSKRATPVPGPQGEQGEAGPAGPPGAPAEGYVASAVATLVTDASGVATWTFPEMEGEPSIVATAVGVAPVIVTSRQVDATTATLHAWNLDGSPAPATAIVAAAFGQLAPPAEELDSEAATEPKGT